jgi:SpoU rRNA methylase family enzyme
LSVPDSEAAVRAYACEIARQVVEGQLNGQEGVRALYQLCLATEYGRDYMIWLELDDALDSLLAGEYPYTYQSATLENFNQVAKQEAEKFIAEMSAKAAT